MESPNTQPDSEPAAAESKHFLASKTFWIALIGVLIAPLLKKLGASFDDAQTQQLAENLAGLATLVGVTWARSKAQGPLHFGGGLAAVLLAFGAMRMLTSCEAVKAAQAKPWVQSLERSAARAALGFVANSIAGNEPDQAWAITQGLNSIVDAVRATPNEQAAQLVQDTAIAFTGSRNPAVRNVAGQLADAFGQAAPPTGADRSLAVLKLASGISSALLAPPSNGDGKAAVSAR